MGNATKVALVALLVLMVVVVARFVREDADVQDGPVSSSDPGGTLVNRPPAGVSPRAGAARGGLASGKGVASRTADASAAIRETARSGGAGMPTTQPQGNAATLPPGAGSSTAIPGGGIASGNRPLPGAAPAPGAAPGSSAEGRTANPTFQSGTPPEPTFKPLIPSLATGSPGLAPTGGSREGLVPPRPIIGGEGGSDPLVVTRLEKESAPAIPGFPTIPPGLPTTSRGLPTTPPGLPTTPPPPRAGGGTGAAPAKTPGEADEQSPYGNLAKGLLPGEKAPYGATKEGAGRGTEEAAPVPGGVHVVAAGDSYWRLAERFYGSGKYAGLIQKANPGIKLEPGKKIAIPPAPEGANMTLAARTPSRAAPRTPERDGAARKGASTSTLVSGEEYIVQAGDTLSSIARKFYGDAAKFHLIEEANGNLKYQTLQVGARIRLPATK